MRGDPVFPFSDYVYAVKRNWKQGFFLGLIDAAILFFLGFDFMFFYNQTGTFKMDVMYFAIFAIAFIYFFMRFYIYLLQMTVTGSYPSPRSLGSTISKASGVLLCAV